jgi:hypothetical protein
MTAAEVLAARPPPQAPQPAWWLSAAAFDRFSKAARVGLGFASAAVGIVFRSLRELISFVPATAKMFLAAGPAANVTAAFLLLGTLIVGMLLFCFYREHHRGAQLVLQHELQEAAAQKAHARALQLKLLKCGTTERLNLTLGDSTLPLAVERAEPPSPPPPAPPSPPPPAPDGTALVALGLQSRRMLTEGECARVFGHVITSLRDEIGTAFQGAGVEPTALCATADVDGDAALSRLELLLALPQLVRPAHWRDELGAYIVRM